MSNTLRFGLVGAGGIAQAYSQAIQQMPNAKLVAVADINLEAAAKMADDHQAASFSSIKQMQAETDLDAVIVCTPPLFHPEQCCDLLNAGINVLCEKPLSIDSDSALKMFHAAKTNNAVFTMASKFRFVEDVNQAKQFIDEGLLGEIILYENCFTGKVDMSQRWNSNPEISGGGVLIDNGTHSLDIMRYLVGALSEIRVVEGKRIQKLPVEDTVHVFVRSESGVMGSIDLSWSLQKPLPHFISIYGTNGTLNLGWRESSYKLNDDQDWTVFGNGYDKIGAFKNQLLNFCGAINGTEELIITPSDGVASVYTVEAAYAAMQQSSWEPVKFDERSLMAK
ncbi:Gfo/Idh/MocA family oxidoreductase [bacterium]|nr:Gfo/Idh/MocA family oxidoreductase [bacterium]